MEEDRRPRIEVPAPGKPIQVPDLSVLPEGDDGMPASKGSTMADDIMDIVTQRRRRLRRRRQRWRSSKDQEGTHRDREMEDINQTKKKAKRSDSSSSSKEDSDDEPDKAADLKQKNKFLVKKKEDTQAEKPIHTPAGWKWCVTPAPAKKRRLE